MPDLPSDVSLVPAKDEKAVVTEYAGYLDEPDVHDAAPVTAGMLRWQHMGTSSLDRVGGKFYNNLEGNDHPYDQLDVVVINGKNSRAYYDSDYDAKKVKSEGASPPDCKSNDAVLGQGMYGPGSPGNPTGRCDVCPMSQWSGRGKDASPPKCSLAYDRLIYDFETHQVGVMSFSRSKIAAIRELQKALQARNRGTVPMWGYKLRLTSLPRENYHVPKFEVLGVLPVDEALKFRDLKRESDAAFLRLSSAEAVTASDGDDATSDVKIEADAKAESTAY